MATVARCLRAPATVAIGTRRTLHPLPQVRHEAARYRPRLAQMTRLLLRNNLRPAYWKTYQQSSSVLVQSIAVLILGIVANCESYPLYDSAPMDMAVARANRLHYAGQSQGGRKLGPRKNTRGLEAGKRQTRWSHCSPGRSEPAADFQDEEGNQNKPANREGKKGRRAYSGRQKAAIAGDEEALGRTQKEGLVKSITDRVPLPR